MTTPCARYRSPAALAQGAWVKLFIPSRTNPQTELQQ
jgi:hypothetical protein